MVVGVESGESGSKVKLGRTPKTRGLLWNGGEEELSGIGENDMRLSREGIKHSNMRGRGKGLGEEFGVSEQRQDHCSMQVGQRCSPSRWRE